MAVTTLATGWHYRTPVGPFGGVFDAVPVTPVRLPHDALRDETRTPDAPARGAAAYYPNAGYTYLRDLEVPESWRGRIVRLEIQGAMRRAQVFVNDELAGNRADGYARFFVDLTPYLRFGETNTIRIELRVGQDSRWYSGAGLHRPVLLHVDEPVHIEPDGVAIRTLRVEDGEAVLEVLTEVTNRSMVTETVRVTTDIRFGAELVEHDETPLTLAPGETATARQLVYVENAALWSVDAPNLHTATVSLGGAVGGGARGDHATPHEVAFGIRTITVHPRRGLRINGEEVLLRGACIHHDNGPLGAAAIGRAEERRIELLKAAGFNAIRAAHNPLSVAMLDACDRLGMLVMDEAFDMWTRFKSPYDYAAEFPQWWQEDLTSLVRKDRNHPSVILYSIGNEIAEVGTPHGARWARRLAEHIRALDPTRPVTNGVNAMLAVIDEAPQVIEKLGGLNAAMAGGGPFNAVAASPSASARIEESSAALDVLGLNYADARYAADAEAYPHRVIVGSETFPSQIGRLWPLVEQNANVIGDFTWTGWDYLGEVGIGSIPYADDENASGALEREYPWLTAWCGDLDITGWRRSISFYREIVFGLRSEPYIAVQRPDRYGVATGTPSPWSWSDTVSSWTWSGFDGKPVTVEVYADGDEVRLLLDGDEVGRAAVGESLPKLASIETDYRPGELTAVVLRDGREVGRTSLRTAGAPRLTVTVDRAELRDDDDDLAFVAIEWRDSFGILVADADTDVTVEVSGAGVLAGLASGAPATVERFDAATRRTFDGRAIAVVRPTGPGPIRVRVTARGRGQERSEERELELTVRSADV
ncbi:glycoside hydrolase family 2 TIM barrel-domain containing protein [Microbacterium radiodurans]|uniref:Glycoside hydrolase family 2 protein n=1 Tax=Microbacterium radiodurans TaxID=661398 RepID=A0A5J5ITU1_9MICO|nr:glycoside hydrolase family 2 TIM barrel-domain containing protein [Microbacterium radiodurans]KAA9085439.1 glycoside hydrolase family 2 protein [Microbacterium radiodurans]